MTDKDQNTGKKELPDPAPSRRAVCNYGRRIGDSRNNPAIWVISFTDIMALMLTFFVLLYSMSSPETEVWEEMKSGINSQFRRFRGADLNRGPQDTIDISKINFNRALDLDYLQALIGRHIENEATLKGVDLRSVSGGLLVSFPQELVFEEGRAEMSEKGSDAVYAIALTLSKIRNRIEIIGHTDPFSSPPANTSETSRWELSLARASVIAGALRRVGYDRPIMARGLADAVYNSFPETIPEEKRIGEARRVDIMIKGDDGSLETSRGLIFE